MQCDLLRHHIPKLICKLTLYNSNLPVADPAWFRTTNRYDMMTDTEFIYLQLDSQAGSFRLLRVSPSLLHIL